MRDKFREGRRVTAPDYNDVIRIGTVLESLSGQVFVRFDDELAPREVFVFRTDKRMQTHEDS